MEAEGFAKTMGVVSGLVWGCSVASFQVCLWKGADVLGMLLKTSREHVDSHTWSGPSSVVASSTRSAFAFFRRSPLSRPKHSATPSNRSYPIDPKHQKTLSLSS